jgi:hypothetical protein
MKTCHSEQSEESPLLREPERLRFLVAMLLEMRRHFVMRFKGNKLPYR